MKIYNIINKIQAELSIDGIGKDRKNVQQGYMFRGIDDIYNALAPLLARHGLCILPEYSAHVVTERQTAKGSVLFSVAVTGKFSFVAAEDGSSHVVTTYGEGMDSGDKATNKAMSAAYKQACLQVFCIPTEGESADSENDSHAVAARPRHLEKFEDAARVGNHVREMVSGDPAPPPILLGSPKGASEKRRLEAEIKNHGLDRERVKAWCLKKWGVGSLNDLPVFRVPELLGNFPTWAEAARAEATKHEPSASPAPYLVAECECGARADGSLAELQKRGWQTDGALAMCRQCAAKDSAEMSGTLRVVPPAELREWASRIRQSAERADDPSARKREIDRARNFEGMAEAAEMAAERGKS